MIIWYILAWYIKLIYEYLNERDKGHENGVWKWWYNPIYMLVFLQYFSSNLHHLSDSIFIWNCCNQAQFLNKKQLWSALLLKFLHEMFYNSQFNNNNCNSRYSYNRQAWVDIPYLLFPWDAVHSSRNMTVCSNWSCYIRH